MMRGKEGGIEIRKEKKRTKEKKWRKTKQNPRDKFLKKEGKLKRQTRKKGKIQSGVAYDTVTTKKNTLLWKICKTKQKRLAS